MLKIRETIRSLYPINLLEGEGVGTAYEYFVKLKKLERFINTIGPVKRILIAGLPERYGLSMDFVLIGWMLNAQVVVVDERPGPLERAREVAGRIAAARAAGELEIEYLHAEPAALREMGSITERAFDLALSSEVVQRLDGGQEEYLLSLGEVANNFAVFAPNRDNESHAEISGLKGVELNQLVQPFKPEDPRSKIFDYGYIDLPPFPPGISRSEEKRTQAAESRLESILMKGLEIYGRGEGFLPSWIKKKHAHIVYVMGQGQS